VTHRIAARLTVLATALCLACGSEDSETLPSLKSVEVPEACADLPVDRFRELMVVDEFVTDDPRGKNTDSGPWSFRHIVETVTPAGMTPSDYVRNVFESWDRVNKINSYSVIPRPEVRSVLICPWLKRNPENGCDADCKSCDAEVLDLAQAPFRLMAIANRLDLRYQRTAHAPAGEGRLAFGLTNGASDDPDATPLRMTVIFEFANPTQNGETPREWAERWHRLGEEGLPEDDFKASLQEITDALISAESLRQIRTNERDLEWRWEFREFVPDASGVPQPSVTTNTPDASMNGSLQLREYLLANRDKVMAEIGVVPDRLCGGAAPGILVWRADVDEPLRKAFANQTCNGCHMTEQVPVDAAFHISPQRTGRERLSPFLWDPESPSTDELFRREQSLRAALCE
jgi:hypothetical protein